MKVKKKSDEEFSKLEPDIQPFLIKVQGLIKHCGSFKAKHVLEKSKKYLIKLRKTVRIYHKNQQTLSFSDELLTSLRSLEFKLADIEEKAKQDIEQRTALNKSSDVLFSTNGLDLTSSSEGELSQKTAKTPENDNVIPIKNHENSTNDLNQSTEKELNSTSSSGFKSDFNDSKNSRENYLIENIHDDQLYNQVEQQNMKNTENVPFSNNAVINEQHSDDDFSENDDITPMPTINNIDILNRRRRKNPKTVITWPTNKIPHDVEPTFDVIKYEVPDNLNLLEVSYGLKDVNEEPIEFDGILFNAKSELYDFLETTKIVKERQLLFKKFYVTQKECEATDERSSIRKLKDLKKLYDDIQKEYLKQIDKMTEKYGIKTNEILLHDLMKDINPSNSGIIDKTYLISGKVKSYCKAVMSMEDMPSPMRILLAVLQHIKLYGITFGKGGATKAYLHDNMGEQLVLLADRYGINDAEYDSISNKSIMFVGKYDLMFLVERILVMTLCYVGVCSNHHFDKKPKGTPPSNSKTYNGLAIVYFTSAKTNNPIEIIDRRIIPTFPPNAAVFLIETILAYEGKHGLCGCFSCNRIARTITGDHEKHHKSSILYRKVDNQFNFSCDGFNCHNSFFLTGLSRVKETFKLERLDHYMMGIDKMFYDLFLINMLYNYIGVSSFDTVASSTSELSLDVQYYPDLNVMNNESRNRTISYKNHVICNDSANLLQSFLQSGLYSQSYKFLKK